MKPIDFRTSPDQYRHWRLSVEPPLATLTMDVDPACGLFEGTELKLNSYDLGVDIELADAVQRLRFEHPEVRCVVLRSGKDGVFCAGANIRMLGRASHAHKVNFCKFTNETRLAMEDASANSGQRYLAAVSGTAAGGGYELAAACDWITLVDDRRSAVSLPEVALLGVLPATGGLTRLTDKRKVRRDRADVFCSTEEGLRGRRALKWRLVDEIVPPSAWEARVRARALEMAGHSAQRDGACGVALTPIACRIEGDALHYDLVRVALDRARGGATVTVLGPAAPLPEDRAGVHAAGAAFYPLALARQLDDAILYLRLNEPTLGLLVLRSEGDPAQVLAADRAVMLAGTREGDNHGPATLALSPLNFGAYPMGNGLTRLATRFLGEPESEARARGHVGRALLAEEAEALGLVTSAPDAVDWDDEVRLLLEERASFSPDALTGLEANLRAAGPETMETRIFGRLSAWQNWIFQRPNAVGEAGALTLYGTGRRPGFDMGRV